MSDLMTIGEFASATWLSPKALRLYDQNGLLSPDTVDPTNGYRKYSHAQIEIARLVTLLRQIDMPLEQIKVLLSLADDERASFVAHYRVVEAEQHAQRQSLAQFVEHTIRHGSLSGDGQPGASRFEVSLRTVPECAVLTSTRHTSAKELPDIIRSSAAQLFQLAEGRGGASGGPIVIYHGQVGWESDGPVEICVPLHDATRAHRVEAGHLQLFTQVLPEDVQFPKILTAFEAVHARAHQLGLSPAGPPREMYTPDTHNSVPRCEVALPVTPDER